MFVQVSEKKFFTPSKMEEAVELMPFHALLRLLVMVFQRSLAVELMLFHRSEKNCLMFSHAACQSTGGSPSIAKMVSMKPVTAPTAVSMTPCSVCLMPSHIIWAPCLISSVLPVKMPMTTCTNPPMMLETPSMV